MTIPKRNYAFIDGSFNPDTKVYGCGGFLIDQKGKKHIIQKSGNDPNLIKMRNVAGELLGSMEVISKAFSLGMTKLHIFYDYDGVANWPTGKWKCKKPYTKDYAAFVNAMVKIGFTIFWHHVNSHAGILENEEADCLAKEAVGLGVKKL